MPRLPGGPWALTVPGVCALLAVLLSVSDEAPGRARIGYAILVLITIGWLALGSRLLNDGPLSLPATICMVVATAVLIWVDSSMANIQFLAYTYAWWASDRRWRNIVANCGVAAAVAVGYTAHAGTWRAVWWALINAAVWLAFSLAMGTLVTMIARHAAHRAVLEARIDAMGEELARVHREAGAMAERERFAHEVHDTLTQTLTGVVMLTERAGYQLRDDARAAASTIDTAQRSARQALVETRSLIDQGHGTGLGSEALATRLDRVCSQFGEETGIRMQVDLATARDILERPDQVVLLRCLQEALANVRKHARASTVTVGLSAENRAMVLTVIDDGVGFPDDVDAAAARGYGLSGMSSRLALAHGSLDITTGPDGTTVSVRLPLSSVAEHTEGAERS